MFSSPFWKDLAINRTYFCPTRSYFDFISILEDRAVVCCRNHVGQSLTVLTPADNSNGSCASQVETNFSNLVLDDGKDLVQRKQASYGTDTAMHYDGLVASYDVYVESFRFQTYLKTEDLLERKIEKR